MVECLRVSGWLSIVDTGQIYTYNGLTSQTQVHTYAFTTASTFSGNLTLDATDRAGNLTSEPFSVSYDNVAPTPPTITVPSAAPATFSLSWSGQDSGAGVRNYDVQVRDAITPTWTPWLTGTTSTEAQFTGSPGHSYYFQVRATDQVNNTGAWQQAGPVAIRSVTKYYTFGSSRVAMRQWDEVYYLHGDHLGSTSLTTDSSGVVVAQSRYLPYGQERWSDGAAPTDFGFTGQRHEAGFGLMDYQARYYDPLLGRFVSADTVVPEPWSAGAFNRYTYVHNNPVRHTDPSGHQCPACTTAPPPQIPWQELAKVAGPLIVAAPEAVATVGVATFVAVGGAAAVYETILVSQWAMQDMGPAYTPNPWTGGWTETFPLGEGGPGLTSTPPLAGTSTLGTEGPTILTTPLDNNASPRTFALPFPSSPGIELPNVLMAKSDPFKGHDPGIPIGELLRGTGQIAALDRNKNLKGIPGGTRGLLEKTLAEAKEFLTAKQFKTLMKHFEDRDLRHGQ